MSEDEWAAMSPPPTKKRGRPKKSAQPEGDAPQSSGEGQSKTESPPFDVSLLWAEVPPESITVSEEVQFRETISDAVVDRYAEVYRSDPGRMPPLDVYEIEGAGLVLASGFHRLRAAQRAQLPLIRVRVHQGTSEDALLFAALDNTRHGEPYTASERRTLILFLHERGWPNAKIAPEVGVNLDTIYAVVRAADVEAFLAQGDFRIPKLGTTHYEEIGRLKDKEKWPQVARAAAELGWPVATTKDAVRRIREGLPVPELDAWLFPAQAEPPEEPADAPQPPADDAHEPADAGGAQPASGGQEAQESQESQEAQEPEAQAAPEPEPKPEPKPRPDPEPEPEPKPEPEPEPKSKSPLAARGAGIYVCRAYWSDTEYFDFAERIEAKTAVSAAKGFVRTMAWDRSFDDKDKPYRGPIRIEVVSSPLDREEVYQGYRHPDPMPPEEPSELRGPLQVMEYDALDREWQKVRHEPEWQGWTLIGNGMAVGGGWMHTLTDEVRTQLIETFRQEKTAEREKELEAWYANNIWKGGEWEPVGPRFHISGPHPVEEEDRKPDCD